MSSARIHNPSTIVLFHPFLVSLVAPEPLHWNPFAEAAQQESNDDAATATIVCRRSVPPNFDAHGLPLTFHGTLHGGLHIERHWKLPDLLVDIHAPSNICTVLSRVE